jgi:hypothetical protein
MTSTLKEINEFIKSVSNTVDGHVHESIVNALDELVISHFCSMASNINNEGLESQIRFLISQGVSLEDIKKAVGGPPGT